MSRTEQFANLYKILKKAYKPVLPQPDRPVLEQLLFACCLENAHYEPAEEAFAALVHTYFDWNEVRVTSVAELSETLTRLPDPAAAGIRLKKILQHIFEQTYNFDLEDLRKANLSLAVERLKKISGVSGFAGAYVVQSTLGGHAIPVDGGALAVLHVAELITQKDVNEGVVPGLERAIEKKKGVEFGSLLHQLGADYVVNPYAPNLKKLLVQINPEAAGRVPKRRAKKTETAPAAPPPEPVAEKPAPEAAPPVAKTPAPVKKTRAASKTAKKSAAAAESASPPVAPATPPATPAEPPAPPAELPAEPVPPPAPAKSAKKKPAVPRKKAAKKTAPPPEPAAPKKGASQSLAKRKPR